VSAARPEPEAEPLAVDAGEGIGRPLLVRLRSFAGQQMVRDSATTFVFHGLAIAVTAVTGVLVARGLGTSGRGELTAVFTSTQLSAAVFAAGASAALPFYQARHPERGPNLLGTWFALAVPLGALASIAGYLLLPVVLDHQPHSTLVLARWYMLSAVFLIASDIVYGFVLGAHHFLLYNVARFAGPACVALGFVVLWASDDLTVETAAATTAGVNVVSVAAATAWAWRKYGIGRPSRSIARSTLWYGLRAQATDVAGLVNLRLDLLIMPALLAASSVGLYSVAANVSTIVALISSSLAVIVLPVAARQGERGARTVIASLQATLAIGVALAGVLAVLAPVLVSAVYGSEFSGSVESLRLLLPGTVLYACSLVLFSGLYSLERPFIAAVAQLAGVALTAAGLLAFLPEGGIRAAALVSSVAYTAVFAVALLSYRRVSGVAWREFVRRPSRVGAP
jgi:O-antigen/teichoic acid export membrane protein